MTTLTDKQQKELIYMLNTDIITDSDLEDFAEEHGLNQSVVFKFVAELQAKGTACEGCKFVEMYPDMPPCISCCRRKFDNYCKED